MKRFKKIKEIQDNDNLGGTGVSTKESSKATRNFKSFSEYIL